MNYNFHGKYSKQDQALFQSSQEDLKKICKYLQTEISPLKIIRFEIFDSREGKQETDPNHSISRASARFKEMAIYRFWLPKEDPHFPHETTHLVAHTWSSPYSLEIELDTWDNKKIKKRIEMVSTSFMQEGLAIAVDDVVFQRKLMEDGKFKFINEWCSEQIEGMPKSLKHVINMDGFNSFANKIVVPFGASLSKYLLQKYGLKKYREMYTQIKETQMPKQNLQIIELVYEMSEDKILQGWRNSLF